jgi:hypothetical protein
VNKLPPRVTAEIDGDVEEAEASRPVYAQLLLSWWGWRTTTWDVHGPTRVGTPHDDVVQARARVRDS